MPYGSQKRIKEARQRVRETAPAVKIPGTEKRGYGSGYQGGTPQGDKKANGKSN